MDRIFQSLHTLPERLFTVKLINSSTLFFPGVLHVAGPNLRGRKWCRVDKIHLDSCYESLVKEADQRGFHTLVRSTWRNYPTKEISGCSISLNRTILLSYGQRYSLRNRNYTDLWNYGLLQFYSQKMNANIESTRNHLCLSEWQHPQKSWEYPFFLSSYWDFRGHNVVLAHSKSQILRLPSSDEPFNRALLKVTSTQLSDNRYDFIVRSVDKSLRAGITTSIRFSYEKYRWSSTSRCGTWIEGLLERLSKKTR